MSSDAAVQLLPLVVLLAFAYLLFIRPARKRAHDVATLQQALSTGDEVMLSSGIFGRVARVEEEKVQLEIAPGVVVSTHRAAVAKIVTDEPTASGSATSEPDTDNGPIQGAS